MTGPFFEQQWKQFRQRVSGSAGWIAGGDLEREQAFLDQARAFAQQDPLQQYGELLERFRQATRLAIEWQDRRDQVAA